MNQRTKCDKCNGSGAFHFGGAVVNGVFQGRTGVCFACQGKGYQTSKDQKRNAFYWNRVARVGVAG